MGRRHVNDDSVLPIMFYVTELILELDAENLVSSSLTQDALVTKVW